MGCVADNVAAAREHNAKYKDGHRLVNDGYFKVNMEVRYTSKDYLSGLLGRRAEYTYVGLHGSLMSVTGSGSKVEQR